MAYILNDVHLSTF